MSNKSHLKRKAFIFFKSSASGGEPLDPPPPPPPQGKYKCLYFRASMLIWIGIGDLYAANKFYYSGKLSLKLLFLG